MKPSMVAPLKFRGVMSRRRWVLRLTIEKACAAARLTKGYWSQLECGDCTAPPEESCRRIARALGLPETAMLALAYLERIPDDLKDAYLEGAGPVIETLKEYL